MKTRLEVLHEMHDAGLSAVIDAELVMRIVVRRQLATIKVEERGKIDAVAEDAKQKVLYLENNLKIVDEMILEEIVKINKAKALEEQAKKVSKG